MGNILFLSCGGLGWPAAMAEMREDGHRIIGVDSRVDHHGEHIPDDFYQVPRYAESEQYVDAIRRIVDEENIDHITGGHTRELILLQEHGFDDVLASDPDALRRTEDKYATYETFEHISPDFAKVETPEELYSAAERMGFPDRTLCIKPVVGSGARGFRILADEYDRAEWTFNHKKDPYMLLDDLAEIDFPPLLLMEYLEGDVYHVDVLADEGSVVKAVVSRRLEERFGFGFSLECEQRPEYVEMAEEVVETLNLNYNCFIQVIDDKLLEVGGRMAGSVGIGLDLAKGAVRMAEGKQPNTEVRPVQMIRYWKEIFVDQETGKPISDPTE